MRANMMMSLLLKLNGSCIGALYRTQTSDDTEENRRHRICKQIAREDGRSAKKFGVNGYVESTRHGSTRNLTRYFQRFW